MKKMLNPVTLSLKCFKVTVLCGAVLSLLGCVSATVQQVRERSTQISGGETLVILGKRKRPSTEETEIDFIDCVATNLRAKKSKLQVLNEQRFVDQTFPWFEPRTAPGNMDALVNLLDQKLLAERLEQMGLKYLIWIEGQTKRTSSGGSMSCGITPGGGGCFGFLTWENDASYEATIWDAKNKTVAGKVSSDAAGTSYMPALILPIPLVARVQSNACFGLADQLDTFFTN